MKPFVFISLLFLLSCTSSPTGGDNIDQGRRTISGKVVLDETNRSPENIFVWLEGFDISTRTDAAGDFSLTLPPSESQNNTGGVSGVFRIYFYLANYALESAEVLVQDGEFIYARADLNNAGSLAVTVTMEKILDIETEIAPRTVFSNYEDPIAVKVDVRAIADSVSVVFPNSIGGTLGAVFMRDLETEEIHIITGPPDGSNDTALITRTGSSRLLFFDLLGPTGQHLPVGRYEVIPYLLIAHETIPCQLIASIGDDVEALSEAYLQIPFRRDVAIFGVE